MYSKLQLQFLQYLYRFNINHKLNFLLLYKFMKQNLSFADKKKIVADCIVQIGLEDSRIEKKTQIMQCLGLILPTDQNNGLGAFKERLADWFIANYFDIKTNPSMCLQYGNLKFLSKQSRDMLAGLFKICQEKVGQYLDYTDVYHGMLMKNPYFNYQHIGYMPPPYMMPHGYPPASRGGYENYEKMYNMDYFMQMSKCYPMSQMYMPPMAPMAPMPQMPGMDMQKYSASQNNDMMMKNPYYSYPMMPQPSMGYVQNQPKSKAPSPVSNNKQKSTQPLPKPSKQISVDRELDENSESLKKIKQKQYKQIQKMAPFFIISPGMQKVPREEIPERINPINIQISNLSLNPSMIPPPVPLMNMGMIPVPMPGASYAEQIHESSEIQIVQPHQPTVQTAKSALKTKKSGQQPSMKMDQQRHKKVEKNQPVAVKQFMQMGTQFKEELRYCVCKGYGVKKQIYLCCECQRSYHYLCTEKRTVSQVEVCPLCYMRNLDPLNKVQVEIKTFYVAEIRRNKISQRIDFQAYDSFINKNSPFEIQVRAMRMEDAANLNPEYTWPDECLVMLNQERTIEFQALQHNSSLKKRKDMSVFLTNYIYYYTKNAAQRKSLAIGLEIKQNSFLEISQKKIRNNYTFLFGIYLVKKKTPDELCSEIYEDPSNKVNFVEKFFSEPIQQQIQIEQIKVTLMDPFTWNLIDIPVRGKKCIHGQCFDLKTFLSFMNVQKVRQWKCPVCNKQCRSFFVDMQQMQVIREFKKRESEGTNQKLSKQVEFHRDGRTLFVIQNQEEEDEEKNNQNSADCNKTKPITKPNQKN